MGTWGGKNSLTVPTDAAVGPAGSGSGLLPGGLEAGAGTRVVSPAAGGSLPRCINGNKYYVDK